jgi:pimeloyl-ACP methyl ester carboxylesterase
MNYEEKLVQLNQHRIYAREYPGEEPTIVLMHGFPDNVHLYDRLVPRLSSRRVVAFDFLGWGASDKPLGYPYTATNQVLELAAVVKQLQLERVVVVAHDASGPPAIDWALANAERVAGLVLLNEDLLPTIRSRSKKVPALREFKQPVRIIFGDADPYLNKGVAQSFHQLFPTSELFLLPGARHFVQMDEPDEVARLILSLPVQEVSS